MHQFRGANDSPSIGLSKSLVAQTDPQGGNTWRQLLQDSQTNSRLVRIPRSGRQQNRIGAEVADLVHCQRIIAFHTQLLCHRVLGCQFPEVLHQIEGEAVVVIDDKQHRLEAEAKDQGRKHQQQGNHQRADGRHQNRCGCAVLGDPGQWVKASTDGQIHHRLNRCVEQFKHQNGSHGQHQNGQLNRWQLKPKPEEEHDAADPQMDAEVALADEAITESLRCIAEA